MRAIRDLFTLAGALLLAGILFSAAAAQAGVVQAVMFWQQGCPRCEDIIQHVLPELQDAYGDKLQIELVEVSSVADVNRLYRIGEAYGLRKDQVGVPLLVIDNQVLVGDGEIPSQLPGLVEKYSTLGGVITQVRESPLPAPAQEERPSGMGLAWVTLVFLVLVTLFALVQIWRALQEMPLLRWPAWVDRLIPVLCAAGMVVAVYLTFVETTQAQAICGPVGDCNAVQNSPYALLFGFLPVGLLGLLGYIAILATWVWRRYRKDIFSSYASPALLVMTILGVLFTIYLTVLEIFVIDAVCLWCISSAWLMGFLLLAALPDGAAWLAGLDEEP